MKITKVETIRSEDRKYCWIQIYTDAGYVGIGETYDRADPAEVVIHEFARGHLLGQNPEDIEKIWNRMYRSASFHGLMGAELRAMSGIDMALWDLLGKTLDRPLYRILGGETRSKVPVYFSGIYDETETNRTAFQDWSRRCVDEGWKACKTARFFGDFYPSYGKTDFADTTGYISATDVSEGTKRFEWVRDAVGDALEVGIDLHAAFDVPGAIRIAESVRHLNPYFIEEPIHPHNFTALKEVRESGGVPIAAGERIFSRWGFQQILETGSGRRSQSRSRLDRRYLRGQEDRKLRRGALYPGRAPQLRTAQLHGVDASDGGPPEYPTPRIHRLPLPDMEYLHRRTDNR